MEAGSEPYSAMLIAKTMTNMRPAKVGAVTRKAARIGYEPRQASAPAVSAMTGDKTK